MSVSPQDLQIKYNDPSYYPERDGKPISDNTLQYQWIQTIAGGLDATFANDPNVFVAADLLWYPVWGNRKIRTAPDAMVAFGRQKGHRGSYLQFLEGGIPPQVVFEVLSKGNRPKEMNRKLAFYEQYGVEEYYIYNPYKGTIEGRLRQGNQLVPISDMTGWVSPRLKIKFEIESVDGKPELALYRPDGKKFASYLELFAQNEEAEREALREQARADQEKARADQETIRARQEAARAEQEKIRAEREKARADRLEALLREQGISFDDEE